MTTTSTFALMGQLSATERTEIERAFDGDIPEAVVAGKIAGRGTERTAPEDLMSIYELETWRRLSVADAEVYWRNAKHSMACAARMRAKIVNSADAADRDYWRNRRAALRDSARSQLENMSQCRANAEWISARLETLMRAECARRAEG